MEQVPPFIPYSVKNDSIWGRGSVDAKACVAAQTLAALRIISNYNSKSLSAPSVSLLFVVGEEKNGDGMRYFSAHPPTNYSAVIFGEPTEGKLASGHKGLILFKVQITGRASHSGYPWLGLSANALMIEALSALINLEERLPGSEKLGPSTLNVGMMKGGLAANVVAEKAEAEVAIRIGEGTPDKIQKLVDGALEDTRRKAVAKGGTVNVVYNNRQYGPVIIDTDIPGFETIGVNYGTDIPNFRGNHKTYLYGPGSILVAHGADEHLKISELKNAVQMYEKMVMYLLEN
jgi:acetylornithine deacetylase